MHRPLEAMLLRPVRIPSLAPLRYRVVVLEHKADIQIGMLLCNEDMFRSVVYCQAAFGFHYYSIQQYKVGRIGFGLWDPCYSAFFWLVRDFNSILFRSPSDVLFES